MWIQRDWGHKWLEWTPLGEYSNAQKFIPSFLQHVEEETKVGVTKILNNHPQDSDEAWFVCASCWELTEHLECDICWVQMNALWELEKKEQVWRSGVLWDIEKLEKNTKSKKKEAKVIIYGKEYHVTDISSKKGNLSFSCLGYCIISNPHREKAIISITQKGKRRKVSQDTFFLFRNIARDLLENYQTYGLARLNYFKDS